jgi:hypothetical protein
VTTERAELPQGTLDLLILKTLELGARHGWAISERLQHFSRDVMQILQGTLYPARIASSAGAGSRLAGAPLRTTAATSISS